MDGRLIRNKIVTHSKIKILCSQDLKNRKLEKTNSITKLKYNKKKIVVNDKI